MTTIGLLGVPVDDGGAQRGCLMGPAALRTAGLEASLQGLGLSVADAGDVALGPLTAIQHANKAIHDLSACAAWVQAIHTAATRVGALCDVPLFLGGDHLMSAGTVTAMADRAADRARPLHVLWLDAHSDFNTLESTQSGNLHGTPAAYATGQSGFKPGFPAVRTAVAPSNVLMVGLRSVDQPERTMLTEAGVQLLDMRAMDEGRLIPALDAFVARAETEHADVHVSFDVDFCDPSIAPAVGTTVPGGATFRETHLIMERLHDSGCVTSVDIAELNPLLDERGKTARLAVDLIASLFGKRVLDRKTHAG